MADAANQQAVAEFAREIVADVAPRELPLFRPVSQAYFKDPNRTLSGAGGADKMLGFGGMASVGTLLTPMILRSTQVGLDSLVSGLGHYVQTEIQRVESWLDDVRAHPTAADGFDEPTATTSGEIPPELAEQIEQIVARQLSDLKCPEAQRGPLANKICASLLAGKLAEDALARERALSQQVHELKIEIDQMKKQQEVERLVQSDYFSSLCERAAAIRRQSANR